MKFTEILPLTDFLDYVEYLPRRGIVRKIPLMQYMPVFDPELNPVGFCIHVLTVSAYGVIIAMLVYCALTDIISVGAFAAVFAALREFYGFMDEVISERLAIAMENMAAVKN